MKINILFAIFQLKMGGSERLVHNLTLNLDRNLFNPMILWFHGNEFSKEFDELGVPLYYTPKNKRFDFKTMQRVSNIIKQNNVHIVNAHHFMPMVYSYYGAKIANSVKLIYTEHSKWEIKNISWKWRIIGGNLLKHSDMAVGVSKDITNVIKKIFRLTNSKCCTIQNGVALHSFEYIEEKRMALRRVIGINNDDKVIGIVANFRKIKNHLFLLEAFHDIRKNIQNVKLLLIGQGYGGKPACSERNINEFIDEKRLHDRVFILGYRSDVPDLLSIMDIFCLTSYKEGMPISLIEAMAAGLPVVGTDVEGIKDLIVNGENGFLVPLGDIMELKKALITLLQNKNLRERMGRESKDLASRVYSLDRCINQYQDLFISSMNK